MGAPKLATTNPLLDRDFVNAFIDGVKKALNTTANVMVTTEKPFIQPDFQPKGDIAGIVGMVNGEMRGKLTIIFSKPAVLRMTFGMIGETKTTIDREVTDAVGEITNQIYGTAKTTLNQMGYRFEMAVPTVVTGVFTLSNSQKVTALIVPFKMPDGEELFAALAVPA